VKILEILIIRTSSFQLRRMVYEKSSGMFIAIRKNKEKPIFLALTPERLKLLSSMAPHLNPLLRVDKPRQESDEQQPMKK
jgi:hypothetical protein